MTNSFEIMDNPIHKLENSLDLMSTLLRYNNTTKPQILIVSLGMNEEDQSYTIELTFKERNCDPEMQAGMKISAPIVKTHGFTPDNAKIARKVFLKYCAENNEEIQGYVNYTWSDFNFTSKLITKLPDISQKYFNADVINEIDNEDDKNLESLM